MSGFADALHNFNIATGVLVLIAYFFIDWLYAQYTFHVVKMNEYTAAHAGTLIYLFSAFGVITYVHNYLYLIPLVIGTWLGTFVAVRSERKKNQPPTLPPP